MDLYKLANDFYNLCCNSSNQLNLFVNPKLGILYPIPKTIIPILRKLSLHEESEGGSNMAKALTNIENNKNIDNYMAVLAIQDKKILGWALITHSNNYSDIDLYTDKYYRRSNIAEVLRNKALSIINEKGWRYSGRDHFDMLKYYENRDKRDRYNYYTNKELKEIDNGIIKAYLNNIKRYNKEINDVDKIISDLQLNKHNLSEEKIRKNIEFHNKEKEYIIELIYRTKDSLAQMGFNPDQLELSGIK